MKVNKKTSIISLFVAGTLLFSSVALADVMIGDGYNSAKQSLKHTAKALSYDIDNFSVRCAFEIKCDGNIIGSQLAENRVDNKNQKQDNLNTEVNEKGETKTDYYYNDTQKRIYKDNNEDKYYQTNYTQDADDKAHPIVTDPFEEDAAKDVERICDALVSNMKDFIQVKDADNGGKLYYGNLSSAQIPALINTLSSVAVKYSLLSDRAIDDMSLPEIKDNLYCKEASAKISEDADGILDNFVGSVIMAGVDADGKEHTIELSASIEIFDINTTTVTAPAVDAENVFDEKNDGYYSDIAEINIGSYRADVIEKVNNTYVKKGEKTLTITEADGKNVKGTIHIMQGDEDFYIDVDAKQFNESRNYGFFYTDKNGKTAQGIIEKEGYIQQYGQSAMMIHLNAEFDPDEPNWNYSEKEGDSFIVIRQF